MVITFLRNESLQKFYGTTDVDNKMAINVYNVTTHLLSIERADWPKLREVFKARDAKTWQNTF